MIGVKVENTEIKQKRTDLKNLSFFVDSFILDFKLLNLIGEFFRKGI
jgi:hypothetical protein